MILRMQTRPVPVEAMLFDGTNVDEVLAFCPVARWDRPELTLTQTIVVDEGEEYVRHDHLVTGQWLVRTPNGLFTPRDQAFMDEHYQAPSPPPAPQHCAMDDEGLVEAVKLARMFAARQLAPSPGFVATFAKALLVVVDRVQSRDVIRAHLEKTIIALDKVCPACLAATSKETWEQLHEARGNCPTWDKSFAEIEASKKS